MRDVKFDLHPWELAERGISSEAEVAFQVRNNGEVCQFALPHNGYVMVPYLRFLKAPDEHFVTGHINEYKGTISYMPAEYSVSSFSQDDEDLREHCQYSLADGVWGRYFYLNEDFSWVQSEAEISQAKWSVFLMANGEGAFRCLSVNGKRISLNSLMETHWNRLAPFRWNRCSAPRVLRKRNVPAWVDWLRQEMKKPDSTIRFAYDLAQRTSYGAAFHCTHWGKGNRQEWETVCRWILRSDHTLWEEADNDIVSWDWRLWKPEVIWEGYFSNSLQTRKRLQMVSNYFAPSLDKTLIKRHLCVEYHKGEPVLRVLAKFPSAHESLEAALQLREWAQDKFLPDEIEFLCGT